MIRTIFLSLWGCSVAVGVMFFLLQPPTMTEELADEMLADAKEKRSFHTEPALLVAPIVHDTKINGFIFSRVTMELAEDTLAHSQIPVDYILQDIYSNYLMGNVKYSFPDVKNFDLPSFRSGLLKAANEALGEGNVYNLYVGNINFIESEEVRKKQRLKTREVQDRVAEQSKKAKEKKDKKKDKK